MVRVRKSQKSDMQAVGLSDAEFRYYRRNLRLDFAKFTIDDLHKLEREHSPFRSIILSCYHYYIQKLRDKEMDAHIYNSKRQWVFQNPVRNRLLKRKSADKVKRAKALNEGGKNGKE